MISYQVAKAIVTVHTGSGRNFLVSSKREPGSQEEGKLEFPGGRFVRGESPREALLRELSEEEKSGELARLAGQRSHEYYMFVIANALHFVFPFQLSCDEFLTLSHHPLESFGFQLVQEFKPELITFKTNGIVEVLGPSLLG